MDIMDTSFTVTGIVQWRWSLSSISTAYHLKENV